MRRLLASALWIPLLAVPARAGDFMDTTVTFVAGDDNVFADAGETIPSSPRPDFGPRTANSAFFDNYDTRDTGEETRTHLVLYKEFAGYFDRLTPEAAMVLEWDANRTRRDLAKYEDTGSRRTYAGIRDDGSYLAMGYDFVRATPDHGRERLSVVLFPFDSDRLRLGYSWELTWGGRSSFLLASAVPGVKIGYETPTWYAYAGAKTARTQVFTEDPADPASNENETVYGLLGGAGITLVEHLHVEINGGYFDKGYVPIERIPLLGTKIQQFGGGAQVTWADGITPQRPVDTRLYRNLGADNLRKDRSVGGFGWMVSAEGTLTSQVLEAFENLGQSGREYAYAGDVNAQVRSGQWTFSADVVARSLEFLVQDTPGLFPFSTIPEELDVTPELFAALGADYYIQSARLIPAITLGVQQPAKISGTTRGATGEDLAFNTLVRKTKNVLGETNVVPTSLPAGSDVKPVFAGKLNLQAQLSPMMTLILEAQATLDKNLVTNDPEEGTRKFETPLILGAGFVAQARF